MKILKNRPGFFNVFDDEERVRNERMMLRDANAIFCGVCNTVCTRSNWDLILFNVMCPVCGGHMLYVAGEYNPLRKETSVQTEMNPDFKW